MTDQHLNRDLAMTQARASHLRLVINEPAPPVVRLPRLRFKPIVRLADGAAFGMHAETDISFEDTFQQRHLSDAAHPSSARRMETMIRWLSSRGKIPERNTRSSSASRNSCSVEHTAGAVKRSCHLDRTWASAEVVVSHQTVMTLRKTTHV